MWKGIAWLIWSLNFICWPRGRRSYGNCNYQPLTLTTFPKKPTNKNIVKNAQNLTNYMVYITQFGSQTCLAPVIYPRMLWFVIGFCPLVFPVWKGCVNSLEQTRILSVKNILYQWRRNWKFEVYRQTVDGWSCQKNSREL